MLEGLEKYPEYDALWHLVAMGVLTPDHAPNDWTPDPEATRPTRIAVIDTSVAVDHPNLSGAVNKNLALDLFSTRLGAFPYLEDEKKIGALELNASTKVTEGLPRCSELLAETIDRLSHGSPAQIDGVQPMTSPEFSNHGTAICGLVGARPNAMAAADGFSTPLAGLEEVPLPYSGVDPNCEIVPISTNFNPDPETLILALLYADLIDADVILLPRIISDPSRTVPELNHMIGDHNLRDLVSQVDLTPDEADSWEELARLLIAVSLQRPIVCAAGNGSEEHGIYPANLASEHNGIISVGAVNAKGFTSGYSATRNLTVCGPSDDMQVFDRSEIRLDPQAHANAKLPASVESNGKFSSFDIISTDVPGAYGYSSSPFMSAEPDMGLREFGSYFCRFGGTSASSALVAGFLSLGRTTGALARGAGGIAAKDWLLSRCITIEDGVDTLQFPAWDNQARFPDA